MSINIQKTESLISELRNGNMDALGELFAIYRPKIRRTIDFRLDHRLRSRVDPSDVLQEIFLAANKRIHFFTENEDSDVAPSTAFVIWIRQIAMQRIVDVHRYHILAEKRDARKEVHNENWDHSKQTSSSLAFQLVGQYATPSQIASKLELMEKVQESIERMNETDREVLALRHFEEFSNDEVACLLNITKAGASNRYVRALDRLRGILEEIPDFFSN